MNNENVESSEVFDTRGDADVGTLAVSADTGTGNTDNLGSDLTSVNLAATVEELHSIEVPATLGVETFYAAHPNLKPGVPVEDIPGLDEERARELGLLKSPEDYAKEQASAAAEAEAFDHSAALDNATGELVFSVNETMQIVQRLGDVTNKSYGKFMVLGMQREAQYMQDIQANLHFNALIELLQEVKARAILLNVELSNL